MSAARKAGPSAADAIRARAEKIKNLQTATPAPVEPVFVDEQESAASKPVPAKRAPRKAARRPASKAAPAKPAAVPAQVHTASIRSTVDLSPVRHATFKRWAADAAVDLGRSRVTTQDVLRALVAELLDTDDLREQVLQRISQDRY